MGRGRSPGSGDTRASKASVLRAVVPGGGGAGMFQKDAWGGGRMEAELRREPRVQGAVAETGRRRGLRHDGKTGGFDS